MLFFDSNTLLWWMDEDPRLGRSLTEQLMEEPSILISFASPWELWIKAAQGKLRIPRDLEAQLSVGRFEVVAPTLADSRLAANLPPIHKDPFDRMIVAQALNRGAVIVTSDRTLGEYGVEVILV
jgi:PIN domain nuclease of toxin-antitoxin system